MKVTGIIAEFNPFHDGHKYLLQKAKEVTNADGIVSVMSGNFTERGLPAINNKWVRSEEAVRQGINLVLELPTCYACNSAAYFAYGGVKTLEGIGADYLAFGSETGDINSLLKASDFLRSQDEELHKIIKELIKQGKSYPRARYEAAMQINDKISCDALKEPNDLLAISYLNEIESLKPFAIKRTGKGYHASATEIREQLIKADRDKYKKMEDAFFLLIREKLLSSSEEDLERIISSGGGLGFKAKSIIRQVNSYEELVNGLKSKAYTRTRISRFLLHTLLGLTDQLLENSKPYIRVLAFDEKGAEILNSAKKEKKLSLPVITNINKEAHLYPDLKETIDFDIHSQDIYNLISNKNLYKESDYVKRPFILK